MPLLDNTGTSQTWHKKRKLQRHCTT